MILQERMYTFIKLGEYLEKDIYKNSREIFSRVEAHNPWFTQDNIKRALDTWREQLSPDMIISWLNPYKLKEVLNPKRVLIVMPGNIPLVGFHDFISVLISGHKVVVKMSKNDNILLKVLIDKLISISPKFKNSIFFIDDIAKRDFDAVIATGSNNSAHYFEYYFRDVKRIIRRNRRSVAVLDGSESILQLEGLADDVFSYFGIGCRNVSKLFLPKDFNMANLFKAFFPYSYVIDHTKYANNYNYNKTICLMGNNKLIENGFLIMKEDPSLNSPVAMLYYEYYEDMHSVLQYIKENECDLQCVVSKEGIPFGGTQKPNLWDYADGVDTIEFLRNI